MIFQFATEIPRHTLNICCFYLYLYIWKTISVTNQTEVYDQLLPEKHNKMEDVMRCTINN